MYELSFHNTNLMQFITFGVIKIINIVMIDIRVS